MIGARAQQNNALQHELQPRRERVEPPAPACKTLVFADFTNTHLNTAVLTILFGQHRLRAFFFLMILYNICCCVHPRRNKKQRRVRWKQNQIRILRIDGDRSVLPEQIWENLSFFSAILNGSSSSPLVSSAISFTPHVLCAWFKSRGSMSIFHLMRRVIEVRSAPLTSKVGQLCLDLSSLRYCSG